MRNYQNLERYLNELVGDIYPQPPDPGHQSAIEEVATEWLTKLDLSGKRVLDVGCGQGQALPILARYAGEVSGVTLGSDLDQARASGFEVHGCDMSFLDFADRTFQLVFARHVLEHSPMPALTLMEWRRVSAQWLIVIVPDPEYFGVGGRNHYSVLYPDQWLNLFDAAGWQPLWSKVAETPVPEFRWLLEKVSRPRWSDD